MTPSTADILLLTIRLRRDNAFPGVSFLSLRCYWVGPDTEPNKSAEVASVGVALDLIAEWLREPAATPR